MKSVFLAFVVCTVFFSKASLAAKTCTVDTDCHAPEYTGLCGETTKNCACAAEYEENSDKSACVKKQAQENICTAVTDCKAPAYKGPCEGTPKVCACAADYKLNAARTACEKSGAVTAISSVILVLGAALLPRF